MGKADDGLYLYGGWFHCVGQVVRSGPGSTSTDSILRSIRQAKFLNGRCLRGHPVQRSNLSFTSRVEQAARTRRRRPVQERVWHPRLQAVRTSRMTPHVPDQRRLAGDCGGASVLTWRSIGSRCETYSLVRIEKALWDREETQLVVKLANPSGNSTTLWTSDHGIETLRDSQLLLKWSPPTRSAPLGTRVPMLSSAS